MPEVRQDALKEVVTRQLLTLVLFAVLAWYTAVVPAPAASFVRRSGGGPRDAEGREEGAGGKRPPEGRGVDDSAGPGTTAADDLDWPEFIGG